MVSKAEADFGNVCCVGVDEMSMRKGHRQALTQVSMDMSPAYQRGVADKRHYWFAGLVIGFSNKSRDYRDLARDFSHLERQMMGVGETYEEKPLIAFTNRWLEIEENEPPILRVLDAYCHNELARAMDYPESEKWIISKPQAVFMQ